MMLAILTWAAAPAAVAIAADPPRNWRTLAETRPPAPKAAWGGFYVGNSIGGSAAGAIWNTTCLQPGAPGVTCPSAATLANLQRANNNADFGSMALRGGIYAGFNVMLSQKWVAGVEADFAAMVKTRARPGIPGAENLAIPGSPGLDRASVRQSWETGARARLGYLFAPNMLLFATLGVAQTRVETSATCGGAVYPVGWCAEVANLGRTDSVAENRIGWSVGGGIEFMITSRWLWRAEYRYTDFGSMGALLLALPASRLDAIQTSVRLRRSTAMFGVAYKF